VDAAESPIEFAANDEHETRIAQTFTFDLPGSLYEVRFKVGGSYSLELFTVTPSGTPSATRRAYLNRSSSDASGLTTSSLNETTFTGFVPSEPVSVAPGDRLAVVLSSRSAATVWGAETDKYAGGSAFQLSDTAPWRELAKDLDFIVLVGP
jgi:hypothetical protein